jgi:hypothetical protein
MTRPFLPRFSFRALLVASGAGTKGEFAKRTGIRRRSVYELAKSGLTPEAAENLCERLGLLALEVWPEWATYWANEEGAA